jgi:hypothetical protein
VNIGYCPRMPLSPPVLPHMPIGRLLCSMTWAFMLTNHSKVSIVFINHH